MTQDELQKLWQDPKHWRGFIYVCPEDPRIIVSKRIRWTGYTVNFAYPAKALLATLCIMVLMLLPIAFLLLPNKILGAGLMAASIAMAIPVLIMVCRWEETRAR